MPRIPPAGLTFREATPEDVPSMAEVLAASPDDGALYCYPDIPKYPQDMRRMYERVLHTWLCKPTALIRIAVVPDGSGTKVVGFSSWVGLVPNPASPGKSKSKEFRESTTMDSMRSSLALLYALY